MFFSNETLGWISLLVALTGNAVYFTRIFQGRVKPHAFSWIIWGVITLIVSMAQRAEGAGPGAWTTMLAVPVAFATAALAMLKGEKKITTSDWIAFIAALSAIPLWQLTKDPLYAVIWVTFIDALGFYPTYRKSWHKPWQETPSTYGLVILKFSISLCALERFTWTTALYPVSIIVTTSVFIIMVLWRRRCLKGAPACA